MSHTTFTRRDVLATSTAGAVVLGLGMGTAHAAGFSGVSASPCAAQHAQMGEELYGLVANPEIATETKNIALRTTSCPDCGTGIAPSGFALAQGVWA